MRAALDLAQQAAKAGEVPVGAVVLDADGTIIGRGYNRCIAQNDPSAHAEIEALRMACAAKQNYRLTGAYMVVTLEPCMMCAGALVHARISGVVYGARDPKAGAVESCLDGFEQYFHNHRVWHCGDILKEECAAPLKLFFEENR